MLRYFLGVGTIDMHDIVFLSVFVWVQLSADTLSLCETYTKYATDEYH